MTKLGKVFLSCLVLVSLIGCTAKTKVILSMASFRELYVGEEKGAIEGAMMTLNATESNQLISVFDLSKWEEVSSVSQDELAQSVLVLIDGKKNRYTFFIHENGSTLKVKGEKTAPVYYRSDKNVKELLKTDLETFMYGLILKDRIPSLFFNQAEADTRQVTSFSHFTLTPDQSDALVELMDVDSWVLFKDHQTTQPDMMMSMSSASNGYQLSMNLPESANMATVTIRHQVGNEQVYDTFSVSKTIYDKVLTELSTYREEAQIKPGSSIMEATLKKAIVYGYDVSIIWATLDLPLVGSNSVKAAFELDRWVKLENALALQNTIATLQTESGLILTLGESQEGPIAVVTSTKDSSFKETYGLPDNLITIISRVLSYDESSLPTQSMLDFKPVKLIIMDSWDELGESKTRTYDLTTTEANDLKAILDIASWTKDPNPDRFAFGWTWIYALIDQEGRSLDFYRYTLELTAVHVDGFAPPTEQWIWYDATGAMFDQLYQYIKTTFPKP